MRPIGDIAKNPILEKGLKPELDNHFLTLSKQDHRFESYLEGTFSDKQRALPVDSLHVGTNDEKVTFRIISVDEVKFPHWLQVLLRGFRPLLLPLTLGPLVTVLIFILASGWSPNWWIVVSSALAVFCLHGGAFLLNDYTDHLAGGDRLNRRSGSQIIQRGWIPAYRVKVWAMVFTTLGVLFGLPTLLTRTWLILWVGVLAILLVLGFSYRGKGFKYLGVGSFLIFLGMGPLLTIGFCLAAVGKLPPFVLTVGSLYGIVASLCIQLKNMESLLADSQAQSGTLVSRLGFEKSKQVMVGYLILLVVMLSVLLYLEQMGGWQLIVFVPFLGKVAQLFKRLHLVRSPLSSQLIGLWHEGLSLHLFMGIGLNILLFLVWQGQWV